MDASIGEVMAICEKITWLLSEGEKWLKPESRYLSFPLLFILLENMILQHNYTSYIGLVTLQFVYLFFTAMNSLFLSFDQHSGSYT